jgi:hypothetical protein
VEVAGLADQVHRVVDLGERLEAQEVELHEARLLHPLHVELGGGHVLGARRAVKGDELVQGAVADHHARGVGGGVAVKALELLGVAEAAPDHLLGAHRLAQAGLVGEGLGDGDGLHALHRDHLGEAVHLPVGHLEHAAHVPHGGLGQERAEGDDLADLVLAVALLDVLDHLLPPVHAEVDVEIGHRHPLGV